MYKFKPNKEGKNINKLISGILSIFIFLTGCPSGNNPAGTPPNKGNLPNLSNMPNKTAEQIKKIKVSGRVTDIYTNKPVEKATVFFHVLPQEAPPPPVVPTPIQPGGSSFMPSPNLITSPNPMISPLTPKQGGSQQAPIKPSGNVTPFPGTSPFPTGSILPPASLISPMVLPAFSPTPFISPSMMSGQENEEETVKDNTPSPSDKPQDKSTKTKSPELDKFQEYWTTTNKDGKFWKEGIPQGIINVTVVAPKYQVVTIVNADPEKLEFVLKPSNEDVNMVKVAGMATSIDSRPVSDAYVSNSFTNGEGIGFGTFTNGYGEFIIDKVGIGKRAFAAVVTDPSGKITSFGFSTNVMIEKGKLTEGNEDLKYKPVIKPTIEPKEKIKNIEKKVEQIIQRQPQTQKTKEPEKEPSMKPKNTEEEEVTSSPSPKEQGKKESSSIFDILKGLNPFDTKKDKKEKIYPIIVLKAVTNYVKLSGELDIPKGWGIKDIKVYLTVEKGKEKIEDIYLNSISLDKNAKKFSIELPVPPSQLTYHLQFSTSNSKGMVSYHNEWGLKENKEDFKVNFLSSPESLNIVKDSDDEIATTPAVSWEPVDGAELYYVTLEKGEDAETECVWEAWTPLPFAAYLVKFGPAVLDSKKPYKFSVSAIKGSGVKAGDKLQYKTLIKSTWTDFASVYGDQFLISDKKKD